MLASLDIGDPDGEVEAAYLAKEPPRETYLADHVFDARRHPTVFYDHGAASGVPELQRLARTVGRWATPILRWHRTRLTNAATEGPTSSSRTSSDSASAPATSTTIDSDSSCAAATHRSTVLSHRAVAPIRSRPLTRHRVEIP
jgi:hypothetical protein